MKQQILRPLCFGFHEKIKDWQLLLKIYSDSTQIYESGDEAVMRLSAVETSRNRKVSRDDPL
jgi:hypothetical protein